MFPKVSAVSIYGISTNNMYYGGDYHLNTFLGAFAVQVARTFQFQT